MLMPLDDRLVQQQHANSTCTTLMYKHKFQLSNFYVFDDITHFLLADSIEGHGLQFVSVCFVNKTPWKHFLVPVPRMGKIQKVGSGRRSTVKTYFFFLACFKIVKCILSWKKSLQIKFFFSLFNLIQFSSVRFEN